MDWRRVGRFPAEAWRITSNEIEQTLHRTQSNERVRCSSAINSNTELCCEFDAQTKSNQIIKWNEIEQFSFDFVRLSSEIEI